MAVLVIGEQSQGAVQQTTLNILTAARQLEGPVDLLLSGGHGVQEAAAAAAGFAGIRRVRVLEGEAYAEGLAENIAPVLVALASEYTHLLGISSTFGKNLLPRVAALLDVEAISDVVAIEDAATFLRPVYAGNLQVRVSSADPVKVMTVRATAFAAAPGEGGAAEIQEVEGMGDQGLSRFVSRALNPSDRPELASAAVVVSGGRGLGSAEQFDGVLAPLADRLGAALGASRAAVDSGFVPNDLQVGQTGKIVAPQLYVAVGISGAIQHLAGMKDSQVIVAINKDADAPIFEVADYGLVGDLFQAVPELVAGLE